MAQNRIVDSRLLGVWRSDKAMTLAEWVFSESTSLEARAKLANQFGRFVMRYTPARVFTEFEGGRTVCPYRVAAIDAVSVVIVRRTDGHDEIQHIHFIEPDIHWVSVGRNREFFRRVEAQ